MSRAALLLALAGSDVVRVSAAVPFPPAHGKTELVLTRSGYELAKRMVPGLAELDRDRCRPRACAPARGKRGGR